MNASLGINIYMSIEFKIVGQKLYFLCAFLDSLKFRYLCFFNPVLFTFTIHNMIKLSANCQDRSKQSLK